MYKLARKLWVISEQVQRYRLVDKLLLIIHKPIQ